MSIYNSSRLAAHKREREEEKYSIGSSGTSATARVRDARRDAYLSEMGQTTSTPVGSSIGRSASTTPTAGSVGSSTSVGGYQAPKTNESKGSGYTPTYGTGALYTSAGSTASGGSDRTTYRNRTSGYTPTYGPGALYTSAGSTASGGSDRTTYRNRTSGYTPTYGTGALYSSTDNIAGRNAANTGFTEITANGPISLPDISKNSDKSYDQSMKNYGVQLLPDRMPLLQNKLAAAGMVSDPADALPIYEQYRQAARKVEESQAALNRSQKELDGLRDQYETRHHALDIEAYEAKEKQIAQQQKAHELLEQNLNQYQTTENIQARNKEIENKLISLKPQISESLNVLQEILASPVYTQEQRDEKLKEYHDLQSQYDRLYALYDPSIEVVVQNEQNPLLSTKAFPTTTEDILARIKEIDQELDDLYQQDAPFAYAEGLTPEEQLHGALFNEKWRMEQDDKLIGLELEKQALEQVQELWDLVYEDKFAGQFAANRIEQKLQIEAAEAWDYYLDNPMEGTKNRAQLLESLLVQFQKNNAKTLDDYAVLPGLSQDFAKFLPELGRKIQHQLPGAIAGAGMGMIIGDPKLAIEKARDWSEITAASYERDMVRANTYRELMKEGVPEERAISAANVESATHLWIDSAEKLLTTLGEKKVDIMVGEGYGIEKEIGAKITEEWGTKKIKDAVHDVIVERAMVDDLPITAETVLGEAIKRYHFLRGFDNVK